MVLATTANPPEFRRRRRMDDVLAILRLPRSFARENFTSSRRRHLFLSSILKVPTNSYTMLRTQAWNNDTVRDRIVRVLFAGQNWLYYTEQRKTVNVMTPFVVLIWHEPVVFSSGGSKWGARGGPPPLLIIRPNWGPRGQKKFCFGDRPPPYLRVWKPSGSCRATFTTKSKTTRYRYINVQSKIWPRTEYC